MVFKEIDNFIATIKRAKTLENVLQCLSKQIENLGFNSFTYNLIWGPQGKTQPLCLTTYPSEFIQNYNQKDHERHDMVFRYSMQMVRPFQWQEIKENFEITVEQQTIFADAYSFNLRNGVSIPIHGPGPIKATLTVANNCADSVTVKHFLANRHMLQLISTYAHEHIISLKFQHAVPTKKELTPREMEVMTWTAIGKTRWEISEILHVSEETIKTHLINIFKKLNVSNKTHAVSAALLNGFISI